MLRKATFFVFEASHINTLRVTSLAGNSYPYYQDKKKPFNYLCFHHYYSSLKSIKIRYYLQ